MIKRFINSIYCYRCIVCGKFISYEQFADCARCSKCNGGK